MIEAGQVSFESIVEDVASGGGMECCVKLFVILHSGVVVRSCNLASSIVGLISGDK